MDVVLSTLGIAVVAFASTNVDDLLVLSAFFADRGLKRRAIVLGQFLGIATLTAASALAAMLALTVPPGWTALLGLAPLGLGIARLSALWRARDDNSGVDAEAAEHRMELRTHSQLLAVAAVTLANGGDNLGVYIPMFASDPSVVPLYTTVFAVMTALWCLLGYALVANRIGETVVRRWGHIVLPFVLIGIGLHILWGARAIMAGG